MPDLISYADKGEDYITVDYLPSPPFPAQTLALPSPELFTCCTILVDQRRVVLVFQWKCCCLVKCCDSLVLVLVQKRRL